jgi:hypothetical protein
VQIITAMLALSIRQRVLFTHELAAPLRRAGD